MIYSCPKLCTFHFSQSPGTWHVFLTVAVSRGLIRGLVSVAVPDIHFRNQNGESLGREASDIELTITLQTARFSKSGYDRVSVAPNAGSLKVR